MNTYTAVQSSPENNGDKIPTSKHFMRQVFICTTTCLVYFLFGLSFGIPTVMIPQLIREANSTEAVSEEMASWLSSIFGYSALPWVFIISIFTRQFGRKLPFAIVSLNTTSYYTVLYFSVNTTQILISEIMQGMNVASNVTLSVIIVSEYSSPKYRGVFLAMKSATLFWGVWVANAMGTFFYWKYIPLLGMVLSIFCFSVFLWPESPQWLASKGRFDDCIIAHRWLRGTDAESEKELEKLIKSQTVNSKENSSRNVLKSYAKKEFYKPMLLSVLMMMQYHFSGKVVCMVYSIDIIKKITSSESTAYAGMLILDGVTVTGMYIGCYLSKILKRRQLLFSCSIIAILFLFLTSGYLYLVDLKLVTENRIVTISLLTIFSVSISCGPMILSTSIYGEITPLRYKSSCTMISAFVFVMSTSTLLKIFPYIVKTFAMSGAFLFYGVSSFLIAAILFKYLPETKDKTLQEIEDIFKDKKDDDVNKELMSITK